MKKHHPLEEMKLEKHDQEIEPEHEPWYKGPIKIIVGLFLILILILWVVPHYGIKQNPEPSRIPELEEVFLYGGKPSNETFVLESQSDFRNFINPRNPTIKTTANRIVALACPQSNKICHAKALYYFIRDNFQYISDPVNFEYVERTEDFFLSGGGDCESGTLAMANLMESVGIRSELVLIPSHALLRIQLPESVSSYKREGDWVYLDWTCKNCRFGELPYQDVNKKERYVQLN